MTIEEIEQAKYERVWQEDAYRQVCHAETLWIEHRECFPDEFSTALDIGCGLGNMVSRWNDVGIDAYGVDIAGNCLSQVVAESYAKKVFVCPIWLFVRQAVEGKFDVGVCADVMEHIPRNKVGKSLRHIAHCCKHIVLKIDHKENSFIGETLHLTIEPVEWWIEQMNAIAGNARFVRTSARGGGVLGSIVVWRTGAC